MQLSSTYFAAFFHQPNVTQRLGLIRISVGVVAFVVLALGFDTAFTQALAGIVLDRETIPRVVMATVPYLTWVQVLGVIAAACFALGILYRLSGGLMVLSLGLLGFVDASLAPEPWAFNTHLLFFALFLICTQSADAYSLLKPSGPISELHVRNGSAAISVMQLYVAVLYFQTGFSKLLHSGPDWFTSGDTAQFFMARIGTLIGVALANIPTVAVVGSLLTGLFELAFLFVFLIWYRATPVLICVAILFHLSMFVALGIAFWHLWILFPALFLLKRTP